MWESLTPSAYDERCRNIGTGFIAATTAEQRSSIAKLAKAAIHQIKLPDVLKV